EVIDRLTSSTLIFQVCGSQSTSTGVAPARIIAAAQEMIVNVGMITSSPFPKSKAATEASRATEPLQTDTPYFRPTWDANSSSNLRTNGPSEDIHPVSMHSKRYFFSLPSNET